MEDHESLGDEVGIANRYKEIVFELAEYLLPILRVLRLLQRIGLWLFAHAEIEDLHLLLGQGVIAVLDDQVNERVCHQHVVEVLEIALQLVIERAVAKTVEDLFTFLDRLVAQNDLFDLVISLDEYVDIEGVEQLVIG